jgi:hypothetical protein
VTVWEAEAPTQPPAAVTTASTMQLPGVPPKVTVASSSSVVPTVQLSVEELPTEKR